ncbi:MAG TPA: hypothetical protein VHV47_12315, partial [Opitutaceae bacterium]|nr:hypothetical protein [Opitutaceae bacterium]
LAATLGLAAGVARADEPGKVVQLPPMIVETDGAPLRWRYASLPGVEILSLCSEHVTAEFARQIAATANELTWMLPVALQGRTSAPTAFLICDPSLARRLTEDIPAETLALKPSAAAGGLWPSFARGHIDVVPNISLHDDDSYGVFALLYGSAEDLRAHPLMATPDNVLQLMARRSPPLPAWFVRGFLYLYGEATLVPRADTSSIWLDVRAALAAEASGPKEFVLQPFVWVSPSLTRLLRQFQPKTPQLLPISEIVVAPRKLSGLPPDEAAVYRQKWICEAALLLRWAFEGGQPRREALEKFVDASSRRPADEAMFRDCFGLGFGQADAELGGYLPRAINGSLALSGDDPAPRRVDVRAATDSEVARIKGEWERLEAPFVRQSYPALAEVYFQLSRRTLWRAYGGGDRDPQLLASMGLWECDTHDDLAALPLLEAAVRGGTLRPRACYELARILWEQALRANAGAAPSPAAAQAALEPLECARALQPALPRASELAAAIWLGQAAAPSAEQLAGLEAEARRFPRDDALQQTTAALAARVRAAAR